MENEKEFSTRVYLNIILNISYNYKNNTKY